MKKSLLALVLGFVGAGTAYASSVTLYGIIEEGVLYTKGKHQDATVQLKSAHDLGSRWGIKGVEDLGNGNQVGFTLEAGFLRITVQQPILPMEQMPLPVNLSFGFRTINSAA